jgi:flagellar motor switch protein FliN/FliY
MSKGPAGGASAIDLIADIPVRVTVELGKTRKNISEILGISMGSVIELDKMAGEPVDVLVNGKLIAKGEVVVIDENFGVRITEILNTAPKAYSI